MKAVDNATKYFTQDVYKNSCIKILIFLIQYFKIENSFAVFNLIIFLKMISRKRERRKTAKERNKLQ